MGFDLNTQKDLIYDALIHAIKTNSGIGFHNNDQGHPAYSVNEDGTTSADMGDSPEENEVYQMLRSLTEELDDDARTPIRSWLDFCRLAQDSYKKAYQRGDA